MQPIADMIESNFADPYDIAKKLYGLQTHITLNNLDRESVLEEKKEAFKETDTIEMVKTDKAEDATPVMAVDIDSEKISYAELLNPKYKLPL